MGIIETFRLRKFIKDNEKMINRCNRIAEQIEREGEEWFDKEAIKNCKAGVSIENFKRGYEKGQQEAQKIYFDKASLFYAYAAEGCEFLCMVCGNINTKLSNNYLAKFRENKKQYRELEKRDNDYFEWLYKNTASDIKQQSQSKTVASKSEPRIK